MKNRNISFYIKVKRFFDILFSFSFLIVLLPFFFLIAIAIKLDSDGPILFKQDRIGKDGKMFVMYKFRSMLINSEWIGNTYVKVPKEDFRITKVGKFLRITSIDELPQFFNILKGDMSLIGPRPISHYKYEDFTKEQQKRFEVRPGITGLAQINGRKSLTLVKRCEYDVQYVNSICFTLDVKIFFSTFLVLTRDNY